jgi:GNAT superfamily N-acetyltransferase
VNRTTAEVRPLANGEVEAAGEILYAAFAQAAGGRGFPPPWPSAQEAAQLAAEYLASDPDGALGAFNDGRLTGVGFLRRRGEVATLGPLAAATPNRGVGSALLDALVAHADHHECRAVRLFQDGWNPDSFALYAGRSFSVVDVVACIERSASTPPRIDGSRGLEVTPFKAADLPEICAMDIRLTGLDRRADLEAGLKLVARRRGVIVGFAGCHDAMIGPVLSLDVADLGGLVARLLAEVRGPAAARLSTAAPTAMLAALALGFRVVSVGTVMSRGIAPPARPPQLYGMWPEIL